MEPARRRVDAKLMQELFLLGRANAVQSMKLILDGELNELCFRTRYPKELSTFVVACLRERNELETGAGERCLFVENRETWQRLCETEAPGRILVAHPAIDFEAGRTELLNEARLREHSVVYALANPRPDIPRVTELRQPRKHEVEELLLKHEFGPAEASSLAARSNGNVYLLANLLAGTTERRPWATGELGYQVRALALLGGWIDGFKPDQSAITDVAGEPYETWIGRVYPLTRQEEPPVLMDGEHVRPASRYESWQQLAHYLTDIDLRRFGDAALSILKQIEPRLDLPKDQRQYASFRPATREICSPMLRRGVAETLSLLAAQNDRLQTTAGLALRVTESIVHQILHKADWKQWASLEDNLPLLAEAAPEVFISALRKALTVEIDNPLRLLFEASEEPLFGRNYHCGLLWALEVLAWHPDYLSRVSVILARLSAFSLPPNVANTPLNSLRTIFLTWLPQTLASVEERRAAIQKVLEAEPEVGWRLLLEVLPEGHQTGSYNPKPVWRDWFDRQWTGTVTRHEMMRQVKNYAELAVQCALGDVKKLDALIAKWNHLPREVVDNLLEYLTSEAVADRPDEERFVIWQRLTDEVEKHRKYRGADWAMPDEELNRLEAAAQAIQPTNPTINYQRLFNHYDSHYFESTDYEREREALSQLREDAVRDIVDKAGIAAVRGMAASVKHPAELGAALGRIGRDTFDSDFLPDLLTDDRTPVGELVRGYIWARYFKAGISWVNSLPLSSWPIPRRTIFLASLPFHAAIWRLAEELLGDAAIDYWHRIYPNAFQAGDDLQEAVAKAVQFRRGDIAVSGINCLRHNGATFPTSLALSAVKSLLAGYQEGMRFDQHELIEVIKLLQEASDVDIDDMTAIEFSSIRLLDRFSGAAPKTLERRLATEPQFFHEVVQVVFRSEKEVAKDVEENRKERAEGLFGLLYHWQTPPGTVNDEELSDGSFLEWFAEVERLCRESGHWPIAQQLVGGALMYAPAGLEGLLEHPAVARVVDADQHEEMRRGLTTALFNSRGGFTYTAGREELELSEAFRDCARKYEVAGFTQIAAALRNLAEGYRRDGEREAKESPHLDL